MAAVTASEMRELETSAIRNGWSEESLMDLAGQRLAQAIARFFPTPGTVVAYLGKGHNAGDACVALRHLRDHFGWKAMIRCSFPLDECAQLTRLKAEEADLEEHAELPPWRDLQRPLILLDGLLGIGGKGQLREPLLGLAGEMAWLRQNAGARIAAIDLPSGIDCDHGTISEGTVEADITFQIGAEKIGLMKASAAPFCGALAITPVEPLTDSNANTDSLICPQNMDFGKTRRPFDWHKGHAGRVSIVAGSQDYLGAAILCATGALKAGAGLVTLHVPALIADSASIKCPPEIIVRRVEHPNEILQTRCDARVIGCGLGNTSGDDLMPLLLTTDVPTVLDADALNRIANLGLVSQLQPNHLITPHPGEFFRLAPDMATLDREVAARQFSMKCKATLLLKGSRTLITKNGEPLWINSTGTPGMATAGQGDLLAGVLGALLARGEPILHAAALGAWLCGRAAERVVFCGNESEETLTTSSLLSQLGGAFEDWRQSSR